jgi:hypothetical protein
MLKVNPRLQALLFCWHPEASLLTKHGGPSLFTVKQESPTMTAVKSLCPYQRAGTPAPSLQGGKR